MPPPPPPPRFTGPIPPKKWEVVEHEDLTHSPPPKTRVVIDLDTPEKLHLPTQAAYSATTEKRRDDRVGSKRPRQV